VCTRFFKIYFTCEENLLVNFKKKKMSIIPLNFFQEPKNTSKKLSSLFTLVKQVATIQEDSIVPKHENYG
jgi:hypothetical protein